MPQCALPQQLFAAAHTPAPFQPERYFPAAAAACQRAISPAVSLPPTIRTLAPVLPPRQCRRRLPPPLQRSPPAAAAKVPLIEKFYRRLRENAVPFISCREGRPAASEVLRENRSCQRLHMTNINVVLPSVTEGVAYTCHRHTGSDRRWQRGRPPCRLPTSPPSHRQHHRVNIRRDEASLREGIKGRICQRHALLYIAL